jgi:tetratricopeptide (TPR) repeat protein
MYLSGSKWSMNRKRKRGNPWRLIILVALVGAALYVNQVVVPATPPLFVPTPTPTRSPDSFLADARQLSGEGKYDLAVQSYTQAIQSDPKNINTYIELARLQVLYNQYDSAIENVENAILLNDNNSLAHAVHGWALGRKSDYQLGLVELDRAISIDPGNALAYAYLAEVLAQQQTEGKGDLTTIDKATEASRKALDLNPNLMESHRARGLVLEVTGNYTDAIGEFEQAVAMNGNLADLHLALGRNYKANDIYDKAVDQFARAIALKPDDPQPYVETALTYLKIGEYGKAAQYAQQAVQQKPDDPLLYGYLGTIFYRQDNYRDAVDPLRLATRGGLSDTGAQVQGLPLDTTSMYMYARYGIALAHLAQCNEALQISQALTQAFPDDETNLINAQEMVNVCQEQANAPAATPTVEGDAEATPAP